MTADEFYYKKFLEWQDRGNGDYRVYVRKVGRPGIKANLLSNEEEFHEEVCNYLKTYAKGQEKESILSFIQEIANPDKDILGIIIGATLDACGYSDIGNTFIGLAIVGVIGAALITLLGNKK